VETLLIALFEVLFGLACSTSLRFPAFAVVMALVLLPQATISFYSAPTIFEAIRSSAILVLNLQVGYLLGAALQVALSAMWPNENRKWPVWSAKRSQASDSDSHLR
jgi:hypothetical protein